VDKGSDPFVYKDLLVAEDMKISRIAYQHWFVEKFKMSSD